MHKYAYMHIMKNWNNSRTKTGTNYFSPAYERSFNNIQNLYDVKNSVTSSSRDSHVIKTCNVTKI